MVIRAPWSYLAIPLILLLLAANAHAIGATGSSVESAVSTNNSSANIKESAGILFPISTAPNPEVAAEMLKLSEYTGVLGTAPRGDTISAAGVALEEGPTGPDAYVFFSQTLSNGFYYEGRIYGKYNMLTQNPVFPEVPASFETNPLGYKGVVKVGYNFHVSKLLDITPYLRLEAGRDFSLVYADTNGNYIHS